MMLATQSNGAWHVAPALWSAVTCHRYRLARSAAGRMRCRVHLALVAKWGSGTSVIAGRAEPEGFKAISPGLSEERATPRGICSRTGRPRRVSQPASQFLSGAILEILLGRGQGCHPFGVNRVGVVSPGIRSLYSLDPGLMALNPSGSDRSAENHTCHGDGEASVPSRRHPLRAKWNFAPNGAPKWSLGASALWEMWSFTIRPA